ncbi:MAG: hypothetical protein HYV63_19245 [Candidatus Schekmanbacteria bacterium]|nr:hypothetical protein [Candidatus Schekmanbacteria bacterium]
MTSACAALVKELLADELARGGRQRWHVERRGESGSVLTHEAFEALRADLDAWDVALVDDRLFVRGVEVPLGSRAAAALRTMLERGTVDRAGLEAVVWQGQRVSRSSASALVARLNRRLAEAGLTQVIHAYGQPGGPTRYVCDWSLRWISARSGEATTDGE